MRIIMPINDCENEKREKPFTTELQSKVNCSLLYSLYFLMY